LATHCETDAKELFISGRREGSSFGLPSFFTSHGSLNLCDIRDK
jgi:hypothetical protein